MERRRSMEVLRIPQERIGVLVGVKGSTKKDIEKRAGVKLRIGEDGEVEITSSDPYKEYVAKEVVKAIGRGFAPDIALRLLDEEQYLKIIDLKDMLATEKAIQRQKGRIIGEKGKTKRLIEECSGAKVNVYGSTVSLIGSIEEVNLAAEAIMRLLEGKPHSVVYKFLEKGRKRMKEERIAHMWQPVVTMR